MTVEEKRRAISKYCYGHPCVSNLEECPLYMVTNVCHIGATDEEINNNYEILFGKEDTTPTPPDMVNHPPHYNNGGMECIDEMIMIFGKEAVMHFCLCNAWKYRKRALYKNGQEDMDKSDWYINKYRELSGTWQIPARNDSIIGTK